MTADVPPTGVRSLARWLGTSERPLFTRLDLPDDGRVVGAAVLCPTLGLEAAYSARALRDLAHRLAASGWAALRVDYAGTGDSAGTWTDPHLVAEWLDGIRGAVDHARGLGAERVAVVGLRVGATLGAAALARDGAVDDLVLWDPSATGRAFLREQRALWALLRDQAAEWGWLQEGEAWGSEEADDGSLETPGALFSAATVEELEPLAIGPSTQRLACRELLLVRQGRKLPRPLADRLALPHVESAQIAGRRLSSTSPPPRPRRRWIGSSPGSRSPEGRRLRSPCRRAPPRRSTARERNLPSGSDHSRWARSGSSGCSAKRRTASSRPPRPSCS